MQSFRADVYRGRRVRLAALLSASDTNGEGQLWLRIEGPGGESLASDSGPVKNGSDWQPHDIVLDVPADASRISIGISLDGQGELSVKDLQFEATTSNAPATQNPR